MRIRMGTDINWKQSAKVGIVDAVIWVWFLQTAYTSLFSDQVSNISYFMSDFASYSIVACLAVSALLIASGWDAVPKRYRVICSVGCCASILALLLVVQFELYDSVFELLAFLLFVVFYYGSQILRVETLAKCSDLRNLLTTVVLSFVLYYAISLILLVVPQPVYTAFIVVAPLVFLVDASSPVAKIDPPNPFPWKSFVNPPMLLLLLFGIAGGLISATGGSNPATALMDVFENPSPVYLIMVLAYMVLGIVTVFGYRLRKVVFFTIMSVLWMAGALLGAVIFSVFPDIPPLVFTVTAAVIGVAIVISFIVCQDIWIREPRKEDVRADEIDALADRYGLTRREREVFHLLMEGRSVPFIQKKLYISEGTARTHVKHIYTKLDVHSKQELLDLLN